MVKRTMLISRLLQVAAGVCALAAAGSALAQERNPRDDAYSPRAGTGNYVDGYRQERSQDVDRYEPRSGQPYGPPPDKGETRDFSHRADDLPPPRGGYGPPADERSYSQDEILRAGHRFFGSISQGLAKVVEHAFRRSGRPNGYILGEDAGAAFFAGLRYGEGVLYTKDAGIHKVYWQGPSLGYDFGAEGSRTMVLVYNLRDPFDIYNRFGGIQGSAYFVGGVGIQFQAHDDVILAPIRAGVGIRLGANVGYLKYTRTRTWNPF